MGQVRHGKAISSTRLVQGHPKATKLSYPGGCYGATLRHVRESAQKVRLVADMIRNRPVNEAKTILAASKKRAAYFVDRVLTSALGNADDKSGGKANPDNMYVSHVRVDEGTRMKRWKAGPMGRVRPILRRTCHITVEISGASR
ncbi:MAG: 50S ribosomal protein L22 [Planctomycetota bacterium]|nr:50S ribosomal protein L22 [Planctomycetota bacterium]